MAMTEVILPVIDNNPAGIVKCHLFFDETISYGIVNAVSPIEFGTGYSEGDVLTLLGGNNDSTWEVQAVGEGGSVATIGMLTLGTGYAANTTYETSVSPSGGSGYTLEVVTVTGDVTIPTSVSFLSVGKIRESIDAEAGTTEYDNVDIDVKEDYSVHTEGFWHRLINGYPAFDFELMFTVMEGDDETFSFRGKIYRINVTETEHYLDDTSGTPSSVVRGVAFKLVSSLKVLEEVNIAALCTEIKEHDFVADLGGSGENREVVTFAAIFASMIKLGYGESYSTSLVVNNSTDIQMRNESTLEYESFLSNAIGMKRYFSIASLLIDGDYSVCGMSYASVVPNAYELLKHLCKQFAVIPKYSFGTPEGLISADPAENHHMITLESRGRSSGTAVTMDGKLLKSAFCSDTPRKSKAICASMNNWEGLDDKSTWYSDGVIHGGLPPSYVEFDINIPVDFVITSVDEIPHFKNSMFYVFSGTSCSPVVQGRYWDYSAETPAYVVVAYIPISYNPEPLIMCLVKYLFCRMGDGRVQYERTYGSLKATVSGISSQRNCKTTMRHVINDGVTSRTFYATEVEKSILSVNGEENNKLSVVWVQE